MIFLSECFVDWDTYPMNSLYPSYSLPGAPNRLVTRDLRDLYPVGPRTHWLAPIGPIGPVGPVGPSKAVDRKFIYRKVREIGN